MLGLTRRVVLRIALIVRLASTTTTRILLLRVMILTKHVEQAITCLMMSTRVRLAFLAWLIWMGVQALNVTCVQRGGILDWLALLALTVLQVESMPTGMHLLRVCHVWLGR